MLGLRKCPDTPASTSHSADEKGSPRLNADGRRLVQGITSPQVRRLRKPRSAATRSQRLVGAGLPAVQPPSLPPAESPSVSPSVSRAESLAEALPLTVADTDPG